MITRNVEMSKVAQLEQALGQRSVPVFGRSTDDVPMAICAEHGWQTISIENDWETIYGSDVAVVE